MTSNIIAFLTERGFSLNEISKMSSRELASRLFDAVEAVTYRAASLQPEDLKRLSATPLRLWKRRGEIPGILMEKGAQLFFKNGATPEA